MRTFVAIDIPDEVRAKIARYVEGVRGFSPDARWVKPETLHVTLKFIGELKEQQVADAKRMLSQIQAPPTSIAFRGIGFFPTATSARVFWIGVQADEHLAALAARVDEALNQIGAERERNEYRPHLTLARGGSGRPQRGPGDRANRMFQRLQEKLAALPAPDFGTMTATEFFLYESKLSPAGARYTKIERFPLRASC